MSDSKNRLSNNKEQGNPKIKPNYKKLALLVGKETIFVEVPIEEIYLESYYRLSYDQQYEIFTKFCEEEDRYVNSQKAIVKNISKEEEIEVQYEESTAKAVSYISERAKFSAQMDEIFTELHKADDRIAKDRQETVRLATETRTMLTDLMKQLS